MSYSKSRGRSRTSLKSVRSETSSVDQPLEDPSSGFEATRQDKRPNDRRQSSVEHRERIEKPRKTETELTFVPWRIFVNHIDSYHGKKLAESLPAREYVVDMQGVGVSGDPSVAKGVDANDETEGEEEIGMKRKKTRAPGYEGDDIAEQEEDGEEQINLSQGKLETTRRKFEVIGTVNDEKYERPEDVAMVIRSTKNKELLLRELMKCGVVIYDITQNDSQIAEARWALEAIVEELTKARLEAPKAFERNRDVRYFILISTVITWALTKPLDPNDQDLPFTEADYRKRKPHPNFKEHIKCEREVSTIGKRTNLNDKLKTVVIGSGITYGDEEGPIHYLFKMAWQNAEYLPIFGRGNNKIPLLHVRDLVEVVCMLVKKWPDKRYIVAVEQELLSQTTIIKKISKALTTGKVEHITREEAFLFPEVTQRSYDIVNANINIEPAYVVDNELQWHWDTPFRDNVDALVREYINSRNLLPVKIVVLGPPASGKTKLARSLAKHYGIHYICVKDLITETVQKLINEIEAAGSVPDDGKKDSTTGEEVDEDEDEDEEDEDAQGVEELQKQLNEIRNNLAENNGRLDDDILNKIFLKRLTSKDCQNQGYVIDGYPKTLSQAKSVFGSGEDDEDAEEDDDNDFRDDSVTGGNRKIIPELILVLEASDEFLIERVVCLPEREIQRTHYNEEGMLRRLREYRERNTDDESPIQFFDELEVHPLVITVEDDVCPEMFSTFIQCIRRLGEPRNYGPSDVERQEAKKRVEAEALAASVIEAVRKEREDFERKLARERKMMEWTDLLDKLKQEEEEQLCIMGEPLRHYLVKYIFPTLTQGLIEVARLRPDDPIDFLAEYLFKENPEGKMFEPDYTDTMSTLLDAIEKLQQDILPTNELDKGAECYLKGVGRRFDHANPRRSASKDEATISTEEEDDDDDGQNGDIIATINCADRGALSSIHTSSATTTDKHTYVGDTDAMIASSFSYEEMAEGSRKSFGNSTILSREDSR